MGQDGVERYDLMLEGGTVIDPAENRNGVADIAITDGRIAAIGPRLSGQAEQRLDCAGKIVVPGLVDAHTHIFHRVSKVGAPPDEAHLRRGVVAAADAGTAGASTFEAFKHFIVDATRVRVVCFLNVSVLGLIDFRFGELLNPLTLSVEDALATADEHPQTVRGFKIRLSEDVVGTNGLELLKEARHLAGQAGLPLMVHIGETHESLPVILDELAPGDIIAHCYTGKSNGILDDRGVLAEVEQARARGVLFDSAHGRSNLSFRVARRAIEQGFLPDTIGSDTSRRNWKGPVFDLLTTMSKFLAFGVPLTDIVERTTIRPAEVLGLAEEGYGRLRQGGPANVTVLRTTEASTLVDAEGEELIGDRLEPEAILLEGVSVEPVPWRGLEPVRATSSR